MDLCNTNFVILQNNRVKYHIWNSFIYSTRKAFLESTVVELVYKLDEKSITSVGKGKSTNSKCFWGSHTYNIYIQ